MKKVLFATGNESKAERFKKGLLEKSFFIFSMRDIRSEIRSGAGKARPFFLRVSMDKRGESSGVFSGKVSIKLFRREISFIYRNAPHMTVCGAFAYARQYRRIFCLPAGQPAEKQQSCRYG